MIVMDFMTFLSFPIPARELHTSSLSMPCRMGHAIGVCHRGFCVVGSIDANYVLIESINIPNTERRVSVYAQPYNGDATNKVQCSWTHSQ